MPQHDPRLDAGRAALIAQLDETKGLTEPERKQLAEIVGRITKARHNPADSDDDTELLLRLLAVRDPEISELIQTEAGAVIAGEGG